MYCHSFLNHWHHGWPHVALCNGWWCHLWCGLCLDGLQWQRISMIHALRIVYYTTFPTQLFTLHLAILDTNAQILVIYMDFHIHCVPNNCYPELQGALKSLALATCSKLPGNGLPVDKWNWYIVQGNTIHNIFWIGQIRDKLIFHIHRNTYWIISQSKFSRHCAPQSFIAGCYSFISAESSIG